MKVIEISDESHEWLRAKYERPLRRGAAGMTFGKWCTLLLYVALRDCRVCGCTDFDQCVSEDGPCEWVEADLCSSCALLVPGSAVEGARA